MEKGRKFINFLAGLSKILLIVASVFSALLIILFWIHVISPESGAFDVNHQFSVPLTIDAELFLESGQNIESSIQASSLTLPIILKDSWKLTILYFALLLLLFSTIIYFILQFRKIFKGLQESLKEKTFFHSNLYKYIRRIGFCIFAFVFIDFLNKAFFFLYIDSIQSMGRNLEPQFAVDSRFFLNILFGFIILLIAEIYNEGLKLKQENQLTI